MGVRVFHLIMACSHLGKAYPPFQRKLRAELERAIEFANAGRCPLHAPSVADDLVKLIQEGDLEGIDNLFRSYSRGGEMDVGDVWLEDALMAAIE